METRTVVTMAELDPPEDDPLENFICQVGGRYEVSPEWCIPNSNPRALDVCRALDNLDVFIEDVRRHPPTPYQHEPKVNVADLQVPLEPGPDVVEMRSFTFNYHLHGGNDQEYTGILAY